MPFNLNDLLPQGWDPSTLEQPFIKEEINVFIKILPNDKSLGTYGFNN
jgi:hypothetical protein